MSNRDDLPKKETEPEKETTFSTKEFAHRLGISVKTIYNHRMIGLLNFSQSCDKAPVTFTRQDEIDYKNKLRRGRQ